ncbi:antitoxin VbhA family protein [Frondihabitans sp. 4ASC-45]|uniref:antitoxin VbhA family protein n=1 Tax=Frondihabitans sp. 4ASC-45 TaxID=3111636 RepID=UPI003C21B553
MATSTTETERARRQQMVDETRTSTALEGGRASDVTIAAEDAWVRGELTLEQMSAVIRRAHPSLNDR